MKKDATTFPRFPFLVAYLNGCIMEIWKNVPGYIGLYKVSNHGRVKSVKCDKGKREIKRNCVFAVITKPGAQSPGIII